MRTTSFRSIRNLILASLTLMACAPATDGADGQHEELGKTRLALTATDFSPRPQTLPNASGPTTVTVANIDAFVSYTLRARANQRAEIAVKIAASKCAPGPCPLIDALFAKLDQPPVPDVGWQSMLLTIIGELQDDRTIDRLVTYVNRSLPSANDAETEGCRGMSPRAGAIMLEARAVEALGFVGTATALSAVRAIALSHPSRHVRDSAVAAYIHNSADRVAATAAIRSDLVGNEKQLADRFFKTRTITPIEFATYDNAYWAAWPQGPAEEETSYTPEPASGDPPWSTGAEAPPPLNCPPGVTCFYQ